MQNANPKKFPAIGKKPDLIESTVCKILLDLYCFLYIHVAQDVSDIWVNKSFQFHMKGRDQVAAEQVHQIHSKDFVHRFRWSFQEMSAHK